MSYSYISDSPVGALICSIFLGPLGLQGWLINPGNPDYRGLGVHQRTLTYVIYGLLVATIVFWGMMVSNVSKKAHEDEIDSGTTGLAIAAVITNTALSFSVLISIIFAILLVARKN